MFNKIKSIYSIITFFFIGAVLILFLYGNSTPDFLFQTQHKSEEELSLPNNPTDSFTCGTMDVYYKMIKEDPDFNRRQLELETFTKNYIKNLKPGDKNVVTIPVVVHILYNTPQQNISNAVVQSQIDVLNKDYRRLNADTVNTPVPFKHLGGDPLIEFTLAKRDPLGNPSIGITRTQTSIVIFEQGYYIYYTALGGHDIWDRDKYLNIWVCNLYFVGGYSQFPGGNPATDGVIIHYTAFGTIGAVVSPYNKGRIATHEIGHWFNLWHIWGADSCGDDFVDDTPTQQKLNGDCPAFPHITCNNGPNGDMYMNYMDYTFDNCKNIYTIGQSNRMNAALYGIRTSLLTSNGGIPVTGVPIAHFRSDKMTINPGQSINFFDESGGVPTSWQWTFEGGNPSTSYQQNPTITYPTSGLYFVKLRVSNSYGTDSAIYTNYVKVMGINMLPFSVVYPPTNTYINTYSTDTTKKIFTWTKSGPDFLINYKWKIRKFGTSNEISYNSGDNGYDSLISLRNSLLDSIAMNLGGNSDTVTCIWRVFAYNGSDSLVSQNQNSLIIIRHPVGIRLISSSVPGEFKLFQNYPNPFNPVTNIKFNIPLWMGEGGGIITLKVYDLLGREVKTLVNGKLLPGNYEVKFDAGELSSGVYFYRLSAGNFSDVKRMILIK